MTTDWTVGPDFDVGQNGEETATACINIGTWIGRIECHGHSLNEAKELRDQILHSNGVTQEHKMTTNRLTDPRSILEWTSKDPTYGAATHYEAVSGNWLRKGQYEMIYSRWRDGVWVPTNLGQSSSDRVYPKPASAPIPASSEPVPAMPPGKPLEVPAEPYMPNTRDVCQIVDSPDPGSWCFIIGSDPAGRGLVYKLIDGIEYRCGKPGTFKPLDEEDQKSIKQVTQILDKGNNMVTSQLAAIIVRKLK